MDWIRSIQTDRNREESRSISQVNIPLPDTPPSMPVRPAGAIFLIANLMFASIPSWQDLRMAARSPLGWAMLVGVLAWVGLR